MSNLLSARPLPNQPGSRSKRSQAKQSLLELSRQSKRGYTFAFAQRENEADLLRQQRSYRLLLVGQSRREQEEDGRECPGCLRAAQGRTALYFDVGRN